MSDVERRPIKRLPRSPESEPRYWHPHGWTIFRETRDWDARGLNGMAAEPKVMWGVKRHASSNRYREYFRTLREARAWCDDRKAWTSITRPFRKQ
jgi:hypothetical protein